MVKSLKIKSWNYPSFLWIIPTFCYKKEMTEYDTQYGDIVFAPDDLDDNDPFEELPS